MRHVIRVMPAIGCVLACLQATAVQAEARAAATARVCQDVQGVSSPAALAALRRRHQSGPAAECIADRTKAVEDEAWRVCLSDTTHLARLMALERQHRGTRAGACLARRIAWLKNKVGQDDIPARLRVPLPPSEDDRLKVIDDGLQTLIDQIETQLKQGKDPPAHSPRPQ